MKKFNNKLAVSLTRMFGNMNTLYLFLLIFGIIPSIRLFAPAQSTFLYWSNVIQLCSLPVLAVGQNVIGKASERRAQETHAIVKKSHEEQMQEMTDIKELLKADKAERTEINKLIKEIRGQK